MISKWKHVIVVGMDNYHKFKSLLEYFVAHLEYVVNMNKEHIGYEKYIAGIPNFSKVGQGYNGARIQSQIRDWEKYDGEKICINIYGPNPSSKGSYLNWKGTWENVRAIWKDGHISSLYISTEEFAQAKQEDRRSISELGLFDNKQPNAKLKKFFDKFQLIHIGMSELQRSCIELLKSNYNLILNGAPGTGKTFLAKKIAEALGATMENGQCMLVQFHPSMDYTDFVEGLRPINSLNDSGISFARRNGVFKEFCAAALRNLRNSAKSLAVIQAERKIEECYNLLIDDIDSGMVKEIPLKTDGVYMVPSLTTQNNITLKAIEANGALSSVSHTVSLNRIIKLADKFKDITDLNNIQNIHREVTDVIGGCNASAYWGLLAYLYRNYSLSAIHPGQTVERKNFVFIIDEINRGDLSKIFGELFFSIDPGYRGEKGKVITQFHNLVEEEEDFENGFFVPENVYIIGTMNDIDRSVESMDFAMRRRFAFKEITVDSNISIFDDEKAWPDNEKPDESTLRELKARMKNLNNAIIDRYESENLSAQERLGLSTAYQIGPAYFLKYSIYNDFDALWDYHLSGLLYEYLRGTPNIETKMKRLRKAYNDTSLA